MSKRRLIALMILVCSMIFTNVACGKSNKYSRIQDGLFISEYSSSPKSTGELLLLDNELNLVGNYSINGTLEMTQCKKQVFLYGKNELQSFNLDNGDISNYKGLIGMNSVIEINDKQWAIEVGHATTNSENLNEGMLSTDIIDLNENITYSYDAYFFDYAKNENIIYMIGQDKGKDGKDCIVQFDTINKEFKSFDISSVIKDNDSPVSIVATQDRLLLIPHKSFDLYEVDYNLSKIKYVNSILSSIQYNGFVDEYCNVNFNIKADENTQLLSLDVGENDLIIKLNLNTLEVEHIMKNVGVGVNHISSSVIDGDYIYLSQVTRENAETLEKYNWKTGELVLKQNVKGYWKDKDRRHQIGDIEVLKQ